VIKKLNDGIYRILQLLLTALMLALVVPVTLQVASRFSDAIPHYIWTEEAARFCLIWIVMVGAIIAVRDGSHFDLDALPTPRSRRGLAVRRVAVHLFMLVMALIFVVFGWQFAVFGHEQESEMTGLNMLWIHAAWPLAGIFFALFLGEKIGADVQLWRGRQEAELSFGAAGADSPTAPSRQQP
jgi:TRAP-type transport system small permease protein